MTLADLVANIEAQFQVGESTATSLSVTGEPYVVIGHPVRPIGCVERLGILQEGEARDNIAACYIDEYRADRVAGDRYLDGVACDAAWLAFQDYSEFRRGTLYWRTRPEMITYCDDDKCTINRYVYMRCLISDSATVVYPNTNGASRIGGMSARRATPRSRENKVHQS